MSTIPLRIAAVSLHTSPLASPGSEDAGGMNVVVLEQARALARAGHRIDILTRRSDPRSPAILEVQDGLRLITLDAGPAAPLAKSAMEQAIAPFAQALRTHLHAADSAGEGADLVHSHHWFSGVAALPAARELGIAHLQSFHSVAAPERATELEAGEPAESAGRIRGEREAARGSDRVVAVSAAEARTVRERYDIPESRLSVVPPGVDTDAFEPASRPAAERAREARLLFAARLQPLKAPDLALEVLARIDPALGARLQLVGAASRDFASYQAELAEQARTLGIADRVDLLGALDRADLAFRMREAAALILPSWSETFGLVALEAQSSGTPVIAWSGAGGVREALGPGSALLSTRDPDVWAEAIERLLVQDGALQEASRASRAFAETRTWDASAAQLARVYESVIRRDGGQA